MRPERLGEPAYTPDYAHRAHVLSFAWPARSMWLEEHERGLQVIRCGERRTYEVMFLIGGDMAGAFGFVPRRKFATGSNA